MKWRWKNANFNPNLNDENINKIKEVADAIIDIKSTKLSVEFKSLFQEENLFFKEIIPPQRPFLPVYVGVAIKFTDNKNQSKFNNSIKLRKDGFMKPQVVKNFLYNAEDYEGKLLYFDEKSNFKISYKFV